MISNHPKAQVVQFAKLMYDKGLVNSFEGNISVKHEGRIYITPGSVHKGMLTEDMIVVLDIAGNYSGTFKPSSEVKIHLGAYRDRLDIGAVVHTHSVYATAFAVANKPLRTKAYPEMIVLCGEIPVAPYGTPGTDAVYDAVKPLLSSFDTVLLANHGVMSVGKDILEAFSKVEAAESYAKTFYIAAMLGGETELPAEKLAELHAMRKELLKK